MGNTAMQHYLFMACTSFPYTDGGIGKTNGLMMCNNFTAALIYQEMQLFAPNLAKKSLQWFFTLTWNAISNFIMKIIEYFTSNFWSLFHCLVTLLILSFFVVFVVGGGGGVEGCRVCRTLIHLFFYLPWTDFSSKLISVGRMISRTKIIAGFFCFCFVQNILQTLSWFSCVLEIWMHFNK